MNLICRPKTFGAAFDTKFTTNKKLKQSPGTIYGGCLRNFYLFILI